jgi:NADH dehydrogenase
MLLITGATGFFGKNLLRILCEKKIKTRCLARDGRKINNYEGLEVIEGDILDKEVLYKATQNIDTVIHLAAVIKSSNPKEITAINVEGTKNLVEACIKNRIKKIIYMSSLDATLNRTNTYGRTKLMGEEIIKNSGIDYIILRPSLIYGRGSKDISLLSKFIAKHFIIPVIGSGNGKLQPVYVDDVCEIILKFISSDRKNKTYFIAGEQKVTLNDLIDNIARLFSKKVIKLHIPLWLLIFPLKFHSFIIKNSQLNYESLRLLDLDKTCEIDDLKKDFNFNPIGLETGLRLALKDTLKD